MQRNNSATLSCSKWYKLRSHDVCHALIASVNNSTLHLCAVLQYTFKDAVFKQLFLIFTLVNVLMCTGPRSLLVTLTLEHNKMAQKTIRYSVNHA